MITKKDKIINRDLFRKNFQFQSLSDMQQSLSKTQNTQENKKLVKVIKSGLIDLDKEIDILTWSRESKRHNRCDCGNS